MLGVRGLVTDFVCWGLRCLQMEAVGVSNLPAGVNNTKAVRDEVRECGPWRTPAHPGCLEALEGLAAGGHLPA